MRRHMGFLAGLVLACGHAFADIKPVSISSASNADGRYEVFAVAADGGLYHRWQTSNPAIWTEWQLNIAGQFTQVEALRVPDGRLFVFGLDGGALVVRHQATANGAWAAQSVRSGHDLKRATAAVNADGRPEAFALGGDGALYGTNATDVGAAHWSDWRLLGGTALREIAAERDGTGRLTVAAIGASGSVSVVQQTTANGSWGQWRSLDGHDLVEVRLARSINGKLTLLAVGADGKLYARELPSGGEWSDWTLVSAQPFVHLASLAVAPNANGLLELSAASTETSVLHMAQRPDLSLRDTWTVLGMPAEVTLAHAVSIATNPAGGAGLFLLDRSGPGHVCFVSRASNGDLTAWPPQGWRCLGGPGERAVENAGLTRDRNGQQVLVTQGLAGNTLVEGKATLFRVFLPASMLPQVTSIKADVDAGMLTPVGLVGPLVSRELIAMGPGLRAEGSAPLGPSVGMVVPGTFLPSSGAQVTLTLRDASDHTLMESVIPPLGLKPTKDVNILVVYTVHPGVFTNDATWDADVEQSLRRLAAMLPVRDGAAKGFGAANRNGIHYRIGTACDGWKDTYAACVYDQTRALDKQLAPNDAIDLTIEFRPGLYAPTWNPPGDPNPGGNSARPAAPYGDLRRAACVSGEWNGTQMTAPCFAQELGHNFGLEPATSPHYQDPADPGHSKDPQIVDPYAFDFVRDRPYPGAVGDTMSNASNGSWSGADAVLYNAYDFEYLRNQFAAKPAGTGPSTNP